MDGADGVDNQTSVGVLVSQCLCHWSQLAMTCVTTVVTGILAKNSDGFGSSECESNWQRDFARKFLYHIRKGLPHKVESPYGGNCVQPAFCCLFTSDIFLETYKWDWFSFL